MSSLIGKEVSFSHGFIFQLSQLAVTSEREIDHRSAQALCACVVCAFSPEILTYRVFGSMNREFLMSLPQR